MGALGSLYPETVQVAIPADAVVASADEYLCYRSPGPYQVNAVYAVNDATIATATDTVRVQVGKKAAGTGTFTQVADFPAATGWTADTPRTGAMTATVADTKLAAGDWLAVKKTLAGTGATTGLVIVIELLAGYKT